MEEELKSKEYVTVCSETYIVMLRNFITSNIINTLLEQRRNYGIPYSFDDNMDLSPDSLGW